MPYGPCPTAPAPGGMLIGGGFGTGKSHVLEHLAHVALSEGFVVSKVVISKETPLLRPGQGVPGSHRTAPRFRVARARRSTRSPPACSSTRPVTPTCTDGPTRTTSPVDSRFAATLFLYEHARGDEEFADRIVRFWAGDPLPVADLRRRLKEAGAAATYRLAAIKERDLSAPAVPLRLPSRCRRPGTPGGWCCSTRSS